MYISLLHGCMLTCNHTLKCAAEDQGMVSSVKVGGGMVEAGLTVFNGPPLPRYIDMVLCYISTASNAI